MMQSKLDSPHKAMKYLRLMDKLHSSEGRSDALVLPPEAEGQMSRRNFLRESVGAVTASATAALFTDPDAVEAARRGGPKLQYFEGAELPPDSPFRAPHMDTPSGYKIVEYELGTVVGGIGMFHQPHLMQLGGFVPIASMSKVQGGRARISEAYADEVDGNTPSFVSIDSSGRAVVRTYVLCLVPEFRPGSAGRVEQFIRSHGSTSQEGPFKHWYNEDPSQHSEEYARLLAETQRKSPADQIFSSIQRAASLPHREDRPFDDHPEELLRALNDGSGGDCGIRAAGAAGLCDYLNYVQGYAANTQHAFLVVGLDGKIAIADPLNGNRAFVDAWNDAYVPIAMSERVTFEGKEFNNGVTNGIGPGSKGMTTKPVNMREISLSSLSGSPELVDKINRVHKERTRIDGGLDVASATN